jgi:hypothetical protein
MSDPQQYLLIVVCILKYVANSKSPVLKQLFLGVHSAVWSFPEVSGGVSYILHFDMKDLNFKLLFYHLMSMFSRFAATFVFIQVTWL